MWNRLCWGEAVGRDVRGCGGEAIGRGVRGCEGEAVGRDVRGCGGRRRVVVVGVEGKGKLLAPR